MFERNKLKIKPLSERKHDIDLDIIKNLLRVERYPESIGHFANKIVNAKTSGSAVIMMMGGHVIRSGVQKYIIDLMQRGYIKCIAANGAGIIHDYELSLIGATTESVARYLEEGQFGLWDETGKINDIVNEAHKKGNTGMGAAVGEAILGGNFPYKNISIFAEAYRLNIPATVHVGIGYDIINEHPNYDGAAAGAVSYIDFLKFAGVVSNLEGGAIMNFGSAVMAPEVFLKALSMARNVAHQSGKSIKHFTTLVCDLHDLPENIQKEPSRDNAFYYYRPWKTMLARSIAGGGSSYYVKAKHADTVPALWTAIADVEAERG